MVVSSKILGDFGSLKCWTGPGVCSETNCSSGHMAVIPDIFLDGLALDLTLAIVVVDEFSGMKAKVDSLVKGR